MLKSFLGKLFGKKPKARPAVLQKRKSLHPASGSPKDLEVKIAHSDDFPLFERKLYDVVNLQPSLRHRLCPIEVEPGKYAIVLLQEEIRSDVTEEVVKILSFKFAKASPFYYVTTKSVMVELARDMITENRKKTNNKNAAAVGKKEGSALWALFESAVLFSMKNDASDLHFEVDRGSHQSKIRFRVDGWMTSPRQFQIGTMEMMDSLAYLFNVHSKSGSENTYNENKAQQCQIQTTINSRKILFRWASNQTANGNKVVMRMLYQDETQTIRSLSDLGYFPSQIEIWKRAIARLGGGTIISGVVGSGKSTTMQTVMSMLPDWMAKYTVEDPVEYIMRDTSQISVSRKMDDQDGDPFLAVKRQLKRMDPDVVLIGEIRDKESAGLFRDIAESGHRAFSTVHAPSAIDMITLRLTSAELGIPRDVIATPNFLNLLVYQALVPKVCPHCKLRGEDILPESYLEQIKRIFDIDCSTIKVVNAAGCKHCQRESLPELNGSKGRIVVAEMIEPDAVMLMLFREQKNLEVKEYIRGTRTSRFDEAESTGKTVMEVAMYHVSQGTVDPREVEKKFGSFDQYESERSRGTN
jgi:general secretion pathway protein E